MQLGQENIQIRRAQAEFVVARRHEILHPARVVLRIADQPFGMAAGQLFVQTDR
ncbi:hypothetical protein D3C75_1380230 [compost metagenome]